MSNIRQLLLSDIDYCAWANREILNACSALSPSQLEQDLGASHSSVLQTLRHIFYSERVWRDRLLANALPPLIEVGDQRIFGDPPPEPDFSELQQRWPDVDRTLRQWLLALPETGLTNQLSCRRPDGTHLYLTIWEIVTHNVNHSTLHRGQIISMLRALGTKPPNVDFFSFYMWQQQ